MCERNERWQHGRTMCSATERLLGAESSGRAEQRRKKECTPLPEGTKNEGSAHGHDFGDDFVHRERPPPIQHRIFHHSFVMNPLRSEPSAISEEAGLPPPPCKTRSAQSQDKHYPTRAYRPAQSHTLNQPMKECVMERIKEKMLRLGNSDLLGIFLFLSTWRCHLTAHVPTVRILGLLLSGFQDLE